MFCESTISVLCAVVNSDESASDAEKYALSNEISSFSVRQDGGIDKVVSFAKAAKMLGFKNPQSARNMAKSGLLKSVFGTGTKRAKGVTISSVIKFISSGCKM